VIDVYRRARSQTSLRIRHRQASLSGRDRTFNVRMGKQCGT
jgi:hypothetical protein